MRRLTEAVEDPAATCRGVARRGWALRCLVVPVLAFVVSASWTPVSADVLKVGPHGTYGSIQAAVSDALGAGAHEIRVEQGTYTETVSVSASFAGDSLEMTGGWNTTFTTRIADPGLTTVDGDQNGSVFSVSTVSGSVLIEGFTITNGLAAVGGGVNVTASGAAIVTIRSNRIVGNTARATSMPSGGGVDIRPTSGSVRCEVLDNLISGNTVENTGGGDASAGGMRLYVQDAVLFVAQGNRIEDNTCVAAMDTVYGCGVEIFHNSTAINLYDDNVVRGNRTQTAASSEVQGTGGSLYVGLYGTALMARRNLWLDNLDLGSHPGYHVKFAASGSGILRTSDSVVAVGPSRGVGAWSYDTSVLRLTNLTVVGHSSIGVLFRGFGAASSFYNTIVFGSASPTDFYGTISTGSNLIGPDPLFVDASSGDCHLRSGSPALDAGDNSPPNGLGPSDADGGPRVLDGVVDVGAYEGAADIFEDGFESGTTSAWSGVVG